MKIKDKTVFLAPATVPVMLLLLFLSDALGLSSGESAVQILLRIIVLEVIVFVLPALIYARARNVKYVKQTALRPFAFSRITLIIALLVVMMTGSFLINIGLQFLGVPMTGADQSLSIYGAVSEEGGVILTVLAVCIIPAVCEEFAFRGVLFSELSPSCRNIPAAVAVSLLFACVHLDLGAFVSNFFCSLILCFVVGVTRSLMASMALHALYNVSLVFVLPYIWRVTLQPLGTLMSVFILSALFIIALALAFGEAQAIYAEYATHIPPPDENEKSKKEITLIAGALKLAKSPAIWVSIILFVLAVIFF